ncbi:hypothetical protein DPEC_G00106760 [Dallia pectoralis]|uniref:Uncharacterized protein n=1 Tax=Dallia pectoralis TaxID=75939 RepID=A0ACC2GY43_DALPE|nr:hypothetical protein DPEC_G00106760 [Dallia pectoralis]
MRTLSSRGKSSQSSRKKLKEAIQMAAEAQRVPLKKRLSRFGFWTRRASDRESSESEFAEVMGILLDDKKSKRSTNVKNQKPAVVKPFKRLHHQSDGEQTEPREEKREKTEGQREKAEKQDKVVLKEVKEKMRGLQKSGVEEGRRRREGVERKKFCSLKPVKKTPSAPTPHIPDQTVPEIEEEAEEECGKAAIKGGERKKLREKISQATPSESHALPCFVSQDQLYSATQKTPACHLLPLVLCPHLSPSSS